MAVKYKYAQSGSNYVSISNVAEKNRKDEFNCLGCGQPLIPVLGKQVEIHFRHKVELSCSGETYLHRLAKHKFHEAYIKCLAQKQPFLIEIPFTTECSFYLQKLGLSCKNNSVKQLDLTKYFSETPLLESRWENFIPDILLRSPKGISLFVEIKVSHACSQEKIDSGHRIIEIEISSVDDILFDSGLPKHVKTNFINFNTPIEKADCEGRCPEKAKMREENYLIKKKLQEITIWAFVVEERNLNGEVSLQDIENYEKYIEEQRQKRENNLKEETKKKRRKG